MANSIEDVDGILNSNFVGPNSRYSNSQLINYNIDNIKYLTFKIYKRPSRQVTEDDKFYTITPGVQYRPDVVSKNVYGKEAWWWIIMLANNMSDILEFKAGKTIVIPSPYL